MSFSRRQHWEQIYRDRDAREVSWYQPRPEVSLALIRRAGCGRDAPLIDIGGGASTLVDCLLETGYTDLSVLDIAEPALLAAQQRLGPRAADVDWITADIIEFAPQRRYSLWHDRAVFHFLTETAEQAAYVAALRKGLQVGGHLVIGAFSLDGPQMCSGLPVRRYNAELMGQTLSDGFELLGSREDGHQTPAGRMQQFCFYLYVYRG
ncbi:class I SAM-dependent methyltransferase [Thiohalophilus thiocyanatoxydans]|uniref:Nodulation protein S (NodS) n=1 Tax=Thiohalophilus thiocyanatoxydans TaxID=381308 RepID=A0A4R8IIR3_9GAMM|nr:class I SAM-dependent methyltransferase [Thiohalophilus thiocyanatoxydans]TDY00551.1 nodulation protein S (NodS) [Thiohalophilus thiocyanatoxydans]